MSPDAYEILPGALIISDAHYGKTRPQLLSLLEAVDSAALVTPQLILMGDIFDLLFGQVPVTHAMNRDALQTLRSITEKLPVLYLEGNHDYNLAKVFPLAKVVPLSEQPFFCKCGDNTLLLAHGDFSQPLLYRIYTAIIRNAIVLRLLGILNWLLGNGIIRKLERYLAKKNDCHQMKFFENFVENHLASLDLSGVDMVVEGHYHQGQNFRLEGLKYFNVDAFACNRCYAIVKNTENSISLETQQWEGG